MKKTIYILCILLILGAVAFFAVSNFRSTPRAEQPSEELETSNSSANANETRYLAFQIFTGADPKAPIGGSATLSAPPTKAAIAAFAQNIIDTISTTGNEQRKLAFILGPIAFDHSDAEIRVLIRDAFAIAEEKNIAVGFHIDDSMFWGKRTDLWKNPKNVEWTDWNGTVHPHRYVDWVETALAPQMCYNSPGIKQAVSELARNVIGSEIREGITQLRNAKKEYLFAGLIAGWETHLADYSYYAKADPNIGKLMAKDNAPKARIGYCALTNLGYSATKPPANFDTALDGVVRDFAALWAKELNGAGIPKEKIYTHISYFDEETAKKNFPLDAIAKNFGIANPTYSALGRHSPFSTAFNDYARPGFSTYPLPGTFDAIYRELGNHPKTGWASSEGTNIIPGQDADSSGMSMETYLARMFNHGATLVDIFSWGLGGDAIKNSNPFRIATEGSDAIAAYKKFLGGGETKEGETKKIIKTSGFSIDLSGKGLPGKIKQIQESMPAWLATHKDQQSTIGTLAAKLEAHIQAGNSAEAEKIADEILRLIGG